MINRPAQSILEITPEISDDDYRLTETGSFDGKPPFGLISAFKPRPESPLGLNSIRRKSCRSPVKIDSKLRIEASGNFASPKVHRQRRLTGYFHYIKIVGGRKNKIRLKKINCTCFERFLARDVCACYISPSRLTKKLSKAKLWAISNFDSALARFYGFRLRRTNPRRSRRLRYLRNRFRTIMIVFKKRYVSKWASGPRSPRRRIVTL